MEQQSVEIVIVDDHKIFRIGLEAILSDFENVTVIGEASNGNELMQLLKKEEPDIIFMDINLENESGIDLTRKVLAKYSDIIVIAITSSDEVNNFNEMLEAGASAFLLKNAKEKELHQAIEEVLKGNNFFSREFLLMARQFTSCSKRKPNIHLSEREEEVLKLICQGHSNQEIADLINISYHTVDSHRRNLLSKTGARNTASLVMIAFRDGLLDMEE